MKGKYSLLPTTDPLAAKHKAPEGNMSSAFDFSSPFDYAISKDNYKSAFMYSRSSEIHSVQAIEKIEPGCINKCCMTFITVMCYILAFITFPISGWFLFKKTQQFERLVIYRLGRLLPVNGPGLVLTMPCIDRITRVDMRMKAFSVPPQKIMTSDGATIEIGAELYYRVKDVVLSVQCVQDLNHSVRVLSQTTLQKSLSRMDLKTIDTTKQSLGYTILDEINQSTKPWGVEVTTCDMSPVKLIAEANPLIQNSNNPLNFLTPILFPQGTTNNHLPPGMDFSQIASQMGLSVGNPDDPPPAMVVPPGQEELIGYSQPSKPNIARFMTPDDLLEATRPMLCASLVRQFGCVFKFQVTGGLGGVFYLDLKYGDGMVGRGEPPSKPDVTLKISSDDFGEMLSGQLSTFNAYMTGRLEVDGDVQMASKLGDLVEIIKRDSG